VIRRRLGRWGVAAGVLAIALAVPTAGSVLTASAAPDLPHRTPQQLLADIQRASVDGLSGTVVQHSDLGLPELPGAGSSSLTSLIAGTHTMRVWFAGPDRARLALLGTLGESDVIVNRRDVWVWDSDRRTATHRRLAAAEAPEAPAAPLTPQAAAQRVLDAVSPTTVVTTADAATVAGRPAYELVLAPRDTRSTVREVRVAVDSATKVPLRVTAYARGHGEPAFEVGYTDIDFTRPADEHFRFVPPPGTTVTEVAPAPGPEREPGPAVVGTGWTSVVLAETGDVDGISPDLDRILAGLPRVSGEWGSGRLLTSRLFTILLTDDGRVAAGAVPPELLYAALR
jgi:outer membrane lipoprotein-sorting protein